MMRWGMEIQSTRNTSWLLEQRRSTKWSHEENNLFENALAVHDKETPDRWQKVAAMIPGKTVVDVIKQYKELEDDVSDIEAGLVPVPGYTTSFTLDWANNQTFPHFYDAHGKRSSSSSRPSDQERKKGVPWTEDEHKQFLMGLNKYGKGDWRNISRNFVITRTPTQVASHAQKYFIRQLSGGKDKRRSSIHDITTVNLNDTRTPSPDSSRSSSDQSSMLQHSSINNSTQRSMFHRNQSHDAAAAMVFNPGNGNLFMPPYSVNSYGMKLQGQNLHRGALHEPHVGTQSTVFQMQSSQCHPLV